MASRKRSLPGCLPNRSICAFTAIGNASGVDAAITLTDGVTAVAFAGCASDTTALVAGVAAFLARVGLAAGAAAGATAWVLAVLVSTLVDFFAAVAGLAFLLAAGLTTDWVAAAVLTTAAVALATAGAAALRAATLVVVAALVAG